MSWLSLGSGVKYVAQFASIILLANKLSIDNYGLYQQVWITINLFCTIIPFGITSLLLTTNIGAIYNFINSNKKKIVTICTALVLALLLYLFLLHNGFSLIEKIFLFLIIIFQTLSLIGEVILIKQEKEKTLFWINTFYFIIYFLLHYFIVTKYYSLATLLLGILIITIVKVFFLFMLKNKNEKILDETENIAKQWIYLGTNDVLNVIFKWLDKWIILWLLPTASFAIYFNGTYEIPIFILLLSVAGSITTVEIAKLKISETEKIIAVFKKIILILAAIVLPSFTFLFFNAHYLFEILFANKYNESVPIFLITLLILPSRVVYSTSILQTFGKSKTIVQGVILELIIAIILMADLYPSYGMKGFAFAFVLSNYIQVYYYLKHTGKLLHVSIRNLMPFLPLLIILIISVIIAGLVFFLTNKLPHLYAIIINSIACIFNIIIVYLFFVRSKNN